MRMNVKARRKYRHEVAVPVNVTLPPLLHQKLSEVVAQLGFSGPSDYSQSRIRHDAGLTFHHHAETGSQSHA